MSWNQIKTGMKSRRSKRSNRGQDKPAKEAPKFPFLPPRSGFYLGLVIILWRIASRSGVFTSSFGIKRSEYCITVGRGVAGPGSAFETVLDQHCSEMSTKSGTQRASAGQARTANPTVPRRNQSACGQRKTEAQDRCGDLANGVGKSQNGPSRAKMERISL